MAPKQADSVLRQRATAVIGWLRRRFVWADYAMTPAESQKWARIRSKGLAAYMLKRILFFTVGMAIWSAIVGAIFPGIGDHHTLKRDLIQGGALGALSGFMIAGNIWFRNQFRYLRKHSSPARRIQ